MPNPHSIFFLPTHRNEIIKIVSSLNDKKSPGHDGIGNYLLKNCISCIIDPLVSLTSGLVPKRVAQWIKANKLSLNLQKNKFMLFSNSLENLP